MATSEDSDTQSVLRYNEEIQEDITPAQKLLEEYSKVPPDQVVAHIHAVVCLPTECLSFSPTLRSFCSLFPVPCSPFSFYSTSSLITWLFFAALLARQSLENTSIPLRWPIPLP